MWSGGVDYRGDLKAGCDPVAPLVSRSALDVQR